MMYVYIHNICLNKNEDVCVMNYKFSGLTVLIRLVNWNSLNYSFAKKVRINW